MFRIRIHRQNAKDQFFILDIRFRYQFLETFPVLSSIFCIDCSVNFGFLQVLVDNLCSVVLTVFGQLSVQAYTAIRRCISRNFDVADLLVNSTVYVLHFFVEFLSGLQFTGADVSLLNQEHDVSIVFLLDDTLESVVTVGRSSAAQCLLNHFRGRNHTISYFHSRNSYCFVTDCGFKFQI